MGDIGILLDYTFLFSAILLIGSLSGFLSEKSGIVNIGIDGMMCFGATIFGIFSSKAVGLYNLGFGGLLIAIILSMVITTMIGALHAFACINLKSNHVVVGTAINLLGLALATFLNSPLANILNNENYIMCHFSPSMHISSVLYGSSIILFAIVGLICFSIWFIVSKTKIGLRFRAAGENPNALDAQGINVYKYQWISVLLSSCLAGMGGSIFLFMSPVFAGNVQSLGFLALAILITGGWNISSMIVWSIVFAIFNACANTTTLTQIGIPKLFVFSIPYIITLFALLFTSRTIFPPEHSGIPFNKEQR